jgi:hypothetical protein
MHLDVVRLIAARVEGAGVARHIRKALDPPAEVDVALRHGKLERNSSQSAQAVAVVPRHVVEAGHARPLLGEAVEIDVGHDQLLVAGEALGLRQEIAVLVDQRIAVPRQIRRRFAGAGGRIEVGRDALG